MSQGSAPLSNPFPARGAGAELWLVRPGSAGELEERLRAFADTRFAQVLCAPGPDERAWAESFARAASCASSSRSELGLDALRGTLNAESHAALAARAWNAIESCLGGGAPILVVLPGELLGLVVAQALGFPLERAGALRVDAGRAVLLRDDPLGIVLRRSNVRAPERGAGTPLPSGRPERAP